MFFLGPFDVRDVCGIQESVHTLHPLSLTMQGTMERLNFCLRWIVHHMKILLGANYILSPILNVIIQNFI